MLYVLVTNIAHSDDISQHPCFFHCEKAASRQDISCFAGTISFSSPQKFYDLPRRVIQPALGSYITCQGKLYNPPWQVVELSQGKQKNKQEKSRKTSI